MPAGPFAITSTRSVRLTSPDEGRYTRERAEVSSQLPPVAEQRRHWYEKRIGVVPVHVPFVAASRPPATGEPATVGGTVLCGPAAGSAVTGRVADDVASRGAVTVRRRLVHAQRVADVGLAGRVDAIGRVRDVGAARSVGEAASPLVCEGDGRVALPTAVVRAEDAALQRGADDRGRRLANRGGLVGRAARRARRSPPQVRGLSTTRKARRATHRCRRYPSHPAVDHMLREN